MANLKLYKIKSEMLLRKLGNRFGVDVKMTDEEILMKQLSHNKIDLIFDIGANEGQFSELAFKMGYKGRIVSFEPLTSTYKILIQKSKKYPNWEVAERCAIGEENGEIIIHVSENTLSSSALDILEAHTDAAPESVYKGEEKVKVYKLDTIGKDFIKDSKNIFLKIDTQGFEEKILKGANEFLKNVKGLLVESSLVKLYEGQALFPHIYSMIIQKGFELWGMEPAFVSKQSGRILQIDAVFFK
jgi:FkbM family methyltransferase